MPEMQLSWQPGFTLLRRPAKRPASRRNRQQRFDFVVEHPQRAHHARRSPSVTTLTHSGYHFDVSRENSVTVKIQSASFQTDAAEEDAPVVDLSLETLNDESSIRSDRCPHIETIDGTNEPQQNSCNTQDRVTSSRSPKPTIGESNVGGPGLDATAVLALADILPPSFTSVPPTIDYHSLTQRFKPILNRCMHGSQILPSQV